DGDLTMLPEKYRNRPVGTSIGDKYLINKEEYPYSCYCSSESEFARIVTIPDEEFHSILSDGIKEELIKLEEKSEKKNPIPKQTKLRYPDLKIIPKVKGKMERDVNQNDTTNGEGGKELGAQSGTGDEASENNGDEENVKGGAEAGEMEKDGKKDSETEKIRLEYLRADIQSRILRRHTSLADCFNYMYEKCVSRNNKEKLNNVPPVTLFDEDCQPKKEVVTKWPKYDKLFIGNWVDKDAFAEYVSENLHIKATFTDITSIFENFSSPLVDRLYIGTFYRNFEKITELSIRDFNRRLVEIDGSVFNTFTTVGG
ncbi:cAMP/cGMP/EF-hand domain containing protein, partial [Cryptosporidium felis]